MITGILIGALVGVTVGVIVMALVNAGARADECAECQERQSKNCGECITRIVADRMIRHALDNNARDRENPIADAVEKWMNEKEDNDA